jgi:hypothetical protein
MENPSVLDWEKTIQLKEDAPKDLTNWQLNLNFVEIITTNWRLVSSIRIKRAV